MEVIKVNGIVLSDTNYSESSKILNVYTKEHGKIGIISKGCRNLKSPLRSVSEKLTYGIFNIYYKENGLSTLISVDITDNFNHLKNDLTSISYSLYLLDLTNQLLKEVNNEEIFTILASSLMKIEKGFNPKIITNIVETKYLDYLGVKIELDSCVSCGSDKNIVTIDGDRGGYICNNCYQNEYVVDSKTLKLLRLYYYVDISKIKELNINSKNVKEINKFLEAYYDRYTGLYLKSKDFLDKIIN